MSIRRPPRQSTDGLQDRKWKEQAFYDANRPVGATGPMGPPGPQGPAGLQGAQGVAGVGIPSGGSTGQALVKSSATNYDTSWLLPDLNWLTDVSLSTGKDGEMLVYDGVADVWKNAESEKSPVMTYSGGDLSRIDYASGNFKTFTYSGGNLSQLVYTLAGRTITKVFTYNIDGTLASITQTETYI